ncbi:MULTISPECIES: hypothetical protein [Burkholderia]|uniref:Uncharacterized protein n=2 Tax=Burkholderia contaminans TaxID=488447 RepID=A0A1R1W028_9BURK|nr:MULTISPECIES: hypothetical protein [Burkholderia]UTP26774.1 hypothetical protein NMB33_37530 [Burkholderia sp. FXe9]KKL42537.1 hypothetical protein WR31_11495 [Burkholderia contaminans LMG 23361]MBA9843015.1 hypothetical protein [Burkholderia contaminans]MBA9866252.1 hypothetical protein [Burkholderia contaminans]MBA9931888.1 hypothetical protein [Burkholderia contaminans]
MLTVSGYPIRLVLRARIEGTTMPARSSFLERTLSATYTRARRQLTDDEHHARHEWLGAGITGIFLGCVGALMTGIGPRPMHT